MTKIYILLLVMLRHSTTKSFFNKAWMCGLNHFSHYPKAAVKILVDLAIFFLNNVVIQYEEDFFNQHIEIAT